MSKQPSIKEIVETLAQILSQHGCTKISPEIFRQAKYNKPEASPHLLRLVQELLQLVFVENHAKVPANGVTNLFYVLYKLNFPNAVRLIVGKKTDLSSQELLLIFGFLLAKLKIIDIMRTNVYGIFSSYISPNPAKSSRYISTEKTLKLDSIVVLQKKIDFVNRAILSLLSQYAKLMDKLLQNQCDVILLDLDKYSKSKYLTVCDFLLHGDLKVQKELIDRVSRQNILLKLHYKWLKHEYIFWEWMASVALENKYSSHISDRELSKHDKLYVSLLLTNDRLFQRLLEYYKVNVMETIYKSSKLSTVEIMRKVSQKPLKLSDEPLYAVKNDELIHLQNTLDRMIEVNTSWLTRLFNTHLPNMVALPKPRR